MNNVEVFKNELRNYLYYKNRLKVIEIDIRSIDKANTMSTDDAEKEKYKILSKYSKLLVRLDQNLEETFIKLTGEKAIRYDVEPSSYNEELSEQIRLGLIDKYELQLIEFRNELSKTEERIRKESAWLKTVVDRIEYVLIKMPKEIREVCMDIYCGDKTYKEICDEVYLTEGGLFKVIEREIDKVL